MRIRSILAACLIAAALSIPPDASQIAALGTPLPHAATSPAPQNTDTVCGGYWGVEGDATVSTFAPDTPYGSYTNLVLLRLPDGNQARTLMSFNLASDIPQGAAVVRAELELPIQESGVAGPHAFEVYSVDGGFGEPDVTWNNQPPLLMPYASISTTAESGLLYLDITSLVIHWMNEPVSQTLALVPAGDMDLAFDSRESGGGPRLAIDCVTPRDPTPPDLEARDLAQQIAIARLQSESQITPTLRLGAAGSLRFADFLLPLADGLAKGPLKQVQWFLDRYKDMLRLDDPEADLQLVRRSEDGNHLFFRQRVNGIPVFPSSVAVHIEPGSIIGVTGGYVPDLTEAATPLLSGEMAGKIASLAAGADGKVLGQPQLIYLNMGLVGFPDDDATHLVWRVNAVGSESPAVRFVDAVTGEIRLELPHQIIDLYDMALYTGNNAGDHSVWPCWDNPFIWDDDQWFDETGLYARWPDPVPAQPDAEGYTARDHIRAVYSYWVTQLGRSSYDGRGQEIRMYIHVGKDWQNANAAPFCDILQFGDQMATRDIVGHEYTHQVVGKTAILLYAFQSGALNESYADIFGHFLDPDDWLIGEGSARGTLRDMSDPTRGNQPDRMTDYVELGIDKDLGGVHINSGIHNKAAHLIIAGGTHNGWTVHGMGQLKAQQLFYNVLTKRLSIFSNLWDARDATVAEALAMARTGAKGFTAQDVCEVRNAFAAVELGSGDRDCDGDEDLADLDEDNDGVEDNRDNCPAIPNGGQGNVDGDSLGDACDDDIDNDGVKNDPADDNCPYNSNAAQDDSDANGVGDVCQDTDSDGVPDLWDNCISTVNPGQWDRDKDDVGDACDVDADNDGVNDGTDNCPMRANAAQDDQDGDGVGDVCDLCKKTASSSNADNDGDGLGDACDPDDDNDGVPDSADNCPDTPNPQQHDLDKDGRGTACDADDQLLFQGGSPFYDDTIQFPTADWPWRMTLPVCSNCSHDYLPKDFAQTIHVEIPIGFRARVVTGDGLPVATSGLADGELDLTYYPAPHAARPEMPLRSAATGAVALEPDDIGYQLQIFPAEGTVLTATYPITLQLTTVSSRVFLPAVTK